MITIVSFDGEVDALMEEATESLAESMDRGEFIDSSLGIVRVSSRASSIQDEGVQDETDNSVIDDEDPQTVRPLGDQSSYLGIGLSAAGAGILLFAVGASVYRQKKSLNTNDMSTFQEGATINGLSRFDFTNEDADIDMIRDVEIMPLSPAARTVSDHRYTSDGGSILTLGR